MNLLRIIAFIAALITVIVTSDDILSEKLIREQTLQLNHPDTINRAIRYGFSALYDNLEALRKDYPDFTPEVKHWSGQGSAYLHYLHMGAGLGRYSIRLPDQLIIVDASGQPESSLLCGSGKADCVTIAPVFSELGIIGRFYYVDSQGGKTPAIDIAASWENHGQVETREHCIWAHTSDVTDQKLTVQTMSDRALPYETRDMYGYYNLEVDFQVNDADKAAAPYRYASLQRLTREQFMAQKGCVPQGSGDN